MQSILSDLSGMEGGWRAGKSVSQNVIYDATGNVTLTYYMLLYMLYIIWPLIPKG